MPSGSSTRFDNGGKQTHSLQGASRIATSRERRELPPRTLSKASHFCHFQF